MYFPKTHIIPLFTIIVFPIVILAINIKHQFISSSSPLHLADIEKNVMFVHGQLDPNNWPAGKITENNVTFLLTDINGRLQTTVNATVDEVRGFIEAQGHLKRSVIAPQIFMYGTAEINVPNVHFAVKASYARVALNGYSFPDGSYAFIGESVSSMSPQDNPTGIEIQLLQGGILLTPQNHGLACQVTIVGDFNLNDSVGTLALAMIKPFIPKQVDQLDKQIEAWAANNNGPNDGTLGNNHMMMTSKTPLTVNAQ